MVIDIGLLPVVVQQQILQVAHGEHIEFAYNGELVGTFYKPVGLIGDEKIFGILQDHAIDGLEYEYNIRNEWE